MNSRTVLGVMTSMVLCTGIVLSSGFATAPAKIAQRTTDSTWRLYE